MTLPSILHKKDQPAAALAMPQKPFRERLVNDLKSNWILYLMALPALIYFVVYCYAPMAGLYIAFSDYKITGSLFSGKFVGLEYFIDFFNSYYFGRLIRNTLVLSLETLIFGFPIPSSSPLSSMRSAAAASKSWPRPSPTCPTSSALWSSAAWWWTLSAWTACSTPSSGLWREPIAFLSDPAWFRPIYVASEIWQNFGWDSVVFLAALSSIDLQQFEAAKLDGASRWQTIWHISLPSILPTIVTILLMRLGHVMSIGFEKVFNLYSPATYETADIIATFVYRQGVLGANYSSAAAIGLFNSVINLIIVFIMNKVSRKLAETSLW